MKPTDLALRCTREIEAAWKAGYTTKAQAAHLLTTCLRSIFLTPPPKEEEKT